MGVVMSSTSTSGRPRRRSRLLAVHAFTVLSASALVLGPAALAQADTGVPHRDIAVQRLESHQPHTSAPPAAKKLAGSARSAVVTGPDAPLYDSDGDGKADLLMQWPTGGISQWLSGWGISFDNDDTPEYLDVLTPGKETSADSQVLSLTVSGRLSLWDDTSFPQGSPLWTGSGWQTYDKVVTVGDVTGDGEGDLLARTHTGDLYFYQSTGSVTSPFAPRVKVGTGFGIFDQLVGAGDITGTGHGSLVGRDLDGDLWYYEIDGNAPARLASRVQIGKGWNTYNQIIGFPGAHSGAHGGLLGRTVSGGVYYYEGNPKGSGLSQLTARQDTAGTALPPATPSISTWWPARAAIRPGARTACWR